MLSSAAHLVIAAVALALAVAVPNKIVKGKTRTETAIDEAVRLLS